MNAIDVMVAPVITVGPNTSVAEAAEILLQHRISGVPVVDDKGNLVGMVSESDLMRRAETGTDHRRSWWLEMLTPTNTIATDYIKSHGRKVSDVMTRAPVTVLEDTPLSEIADLLEAHQIKRVPVMRDGKMIGIASRANLLQAFASMRRLAIPQVKADDRSLRTLVLKTIDNAHLPRPYALNVMAKDGNVDLWGVVGTTEEKDAIRIAAEVTPGVLSVTDNLRIETRLTAGI